MSIKPGANTKPPASIISSVSFGVSSPTAVIRSPARRTLPTTGAEPVPSIMWALVISVSATKAGEAPQHRALSATIAKRRPAFNRVRDGQCNTAGITSLNLDRSLRLELRSRLGVNRTQDFCPLRPANVLPCVPCDALTARWAALQTGDQSSPVGSCWCRTPSHPPAPSACLRGRKHAR